MPRTISLTELSPEEFKDLVAESVREELEKALPAAINQAISQPPESRLISRSEGLRLLGVKSRDTALKLERQGSLERVMIGSRVHYKLSDVQAIIRNKEGRS